MERDAGNEMAREMFLNPATAGDGDESPLLDQARANVADQVSDNLELDRAREAAAHHDHPHSKEVDGIVFASGPEPKEEE
jgi:hypothetical protein